MSLEHRPIRPSRPRPLDAADGSYVRVLICTVSGMEIGGTVHIPPGLRTMDLLNRESEAFLPITGATVTRSEQTEQTPFIAVNKAQIVTLRELPRGE